MDWIGYGWAFVVLGSCSHAYLIRNDHPSCWCGTQSKGVKGVEESCAHSHIAIGAHITSCTHRWTCPDTTWLALKVETASASVGLTW